MPASKQKLYIIHTNDIHSHFEQMPKIATLIGTLKQEHPSHEVLTIDCGDHMDRMRIETDGSDGLANIEVMNETGYDAAVLGNNEGLTYTRQVLAETYGNHAKFDVIGSNMFVQETGELAEWMVPYKVIRKAGLLVGVIGVTANFGEFYKLLGWDVKEPTPIIADLVRKLRSEVHILIVISHMGLSYDKRLAEEIEGIDCIFGGHTHHLLEEPLLIRNTWLCATGKFGQYVGEVEMEYDFTLGRIVYFAGKCIETHSFSDSEAVVRIIDRHLQTSKNKLNVSLASLHLPLASSLDKESQLGNLLAAGLRKWTGSEIGIVNAGAITEGLQAGTVTRERLLQICSSPINPCRVYLEGEWILQALEESLLVEYIHKPIKGFGFRGVALGTLCVDGIIVEYDFLAEPYHKIKQVTVNGEALQLKRKYAAGSIDMFTFGIGYLSLGRGSGVEFFLPEFIRDVLLHELLDPMAVEQCGHMNWIPVHPE